jgi:hypothetical protein
MKARVYSSIDAHSLLHALYDSARELPDVFSIAGIPSHGGLTSEGSLRLTQKTTDDSVSATLSQLDERSLIAQLDNEARLEPVSAKRRLGAFLSPLVTQYNKTKKDGLAADDQAVIVFEDDVAKA